MTGRPRKAAAKATPSARPTKPLTPPDRVELPQAAVDRLLAARRNLAGWEKVLKDARAEIEAAMGDSPVGTIDGETVIEWRQEQKRRQFNRKAFAAAHPDLEAEYIELVPGNRPFKVVVQEEADEDE
jgi:hypothetical protein